MNRRPEFVIVCYEGGVGEYLEEPAEYNLWSMRETILNKTNVLLIQYLAKREELNIPAYPPLLSDGD